MDQGKGSPCAARCKKVFVMELASFSFSTSGSLYRSPISYGTLITRTLKGTLV